MSTRSARINILVTPEEKAAIERYASSNDLSVSEHLREAGLAFEHKVLEESFTPIEKEQIELLLDQVDIAVERMAKKLDATTKRLKESRNLRNSLRVKHGLPPI